MIQTIILPDGTPLKFPAGMSDADIAAAIGAEYPQFAAKGGAPAAQEPEPIFRSPDGGRVYKGPDGMLRFVSPGMSTNNPETIAQIMGGSTPADASTYANVTTGGTAMAAGRSLLQGLTSAGGEEFVAKGISLLGGGGYAAELARERARIAKGRDEAPGTTIAAEVLGAMVSPVNRN